MGGAADPTPLLRDLQRFGVTEALLVPGTAPPPTPAAQARFAARLPLPMALGPAAADRLHPRFLLCDAAAAPLGNLARLLADAAAWPAPGRVAWRHADAAWLDGDRVRGGPELAQPGLCLLERAAVASRPFGDDLLPALAASGGLRATVVGDGLQATPRPALLLDRDGTINRDHGYVGTADRWEWVDGAREAVAAATDAGWHVFVVTNQSGVGRGHYDEEAVEALHGAMVEDIRRAGGTVDDIRICPFHPEAAVARYRRVSDWRKPAPGMILDLIARWGLDPARCVMVGDQPTDMAAAEAAGIAGQLFDGGNLWRTVQPLLDGGFTSRRGR